MNESMYFYGLLVVVFVLAGVVKGVTGMGLPTVAMGLLGGALSPVAAASMLFIPTFVTNAWQLLSGPSLGHIVRRLWPMMLAVVVVTLGSAALLVRVDRSGSRVALGVALMVYAAYALLAPVFRVPQRRERWLGPLVGALSGVVTGATGVFVMPAVPYLQSLGLQREELVQALGLAFTVSTIALTTGLVLHGAFGIQQLGLSALAVVPALLGMWLGQVIRQRISARVFRACFLGFLLLLGLELVLRPLF
ncbi:sulfite exporter TauE/SafE family protein [Stenotrophomonas sepilia]|uniref:Probable membrane transporter protein n=1 Tax=Stenotrophomonas sepilia TaxID=2860290 RepID=A0ABQ6QCP9_9GAMM|nr:sulfite exporter TauE/SafE family protein [Stenotrophomonas sepilia]